MEWVETTGRTVEEAKDAALDQLGVDETDAEFEIVSEPRAGLFGRVRGEARVRARVVPTAPRPKRGRTRRTGAERSSGGGRQSRSTTSTGSRGGGSGRTVSGATAAVLEDEDETAADPRATGSGGEVTAEVEAGAGPGGPGTGTGQAKRRRSRGGRGRGGGQRAQSGQPGGGRPAAGDAGAEDENDEGSERPSSADRSSQGGRAGRSRAADGRKEEAVGETLSLEEQGESAREFIVGLVRELGLAAEVSVRVVDEDTAEVDVQGEGLGLLVGPGGATLGALQELARTVVQKRTGGHSDRILVDVAGYRARRSEALGRFTHQIAQEVLEAGSERALEPMLAADRKVVHDTVNEIDGVVTRSEGEEPRRYVVISPSAASPADA